MTRQLFEINIPMPSQSGTNMERSKHKRKKRETNDLTRLDNLPMSSGQREKILLKQYSYKGYRVIQKSN